MFSERMEIDDAYLDGERSGKRGRGTEYNFPFVTAVQTAEEGHHQRIQLRRVSGFNLAEIRRYAQQAIAPGSQVISDGLRCFRAFDISTYVHERYITGSGRASTSNPDFNSVNTLLGKVKITITYHAIRWQRPPRYLAKFEYRFNRRYDLKAMIPSFLTVPVTIHPLRPCRCPVASA